ncbi:hypothetical protein ACFLUZ_06345 [Chloroflexota bacterium]
MTRQEEYLIKRIVQHLRYIRDNWNDNIELEEVVRSSNVLRTLLVHNDLGRAWRLCGYTYPIRLQVFTLKRILITYDKDKILTAWTGGARYRGTIYALGVAFSGEAPKTNSSLTTATGRQELTLDEYRKNTFMVVRAKDAGLIEINRLELINYVANKLGGTHIDFARKSNKTLEQKFIALDGAHNYEDVDRNIVPLQLLSVGQELVSSRHIQRLMKRNV